MSRRKRHQFAFHLDSETRRGLLVVFLWAFAVLQLLAFFSLAGTFGQSLNESLSFVFGWDKILVPFVFILWGYATFAPEKFVLRFTNILGSIVLFLSLNPLIHIVSFAPHTNVPDAALSVAGGRLGQVIAEPLADLVGRAGAMTLTVAVLAVALILAFDATLSEILFLFRWALQGLTWFAQSLRRLIQTWRDARARRVHGLNAATPTSNSALATTEEFIDEQIGSSEALVLAQNTNDDVADSLDDNNIVNDVASPPKPRKRYPRIEMPLELLERRDQRPTSGDIVHNRDVIRRTLDTFGIPVEMGEVSVGPTVTQFTLKPSEGVKLSRITGLHNDLALALAAHPIRIEAPIPGKSLVGVEVPNQTIATVGAREIIDTREFRERKSVLTFALGKDVAGKPWVADLTRMPHLLVAGATGSGKSVCLNVIINSFLYTCGPDDVKFIMVDPKRVELQIYNGIPHLITPVITRVPETVNALKWALREMDKRYDLLAKFNSRDLASYNARIQDKLPYIVIVIDELADLMVTAATDVEGPIVRLAQMARAVGIHLVLATQRPSVEVITGLIKANIPARIAFAVASSTDSRTILDQQGAEKLLGRGDMLFSTADMSTPKRVQGAFISDHEIHRVVEYIKSKYEPADYDHSITERASGSTTIFNGDSNDADSDPLLPAAKDEIMRAGKASASLLQRRLKVGYARAARILDLLEQDGFIGPSDGAKPREILQGLSSSETEIPTPNGDVGQEE